MPQKTAVRRPFVWVSVALVGGTAFSSAFGPPFPPFLAAFLSAWLLAVLMIIMKRRTLAALFAVIASFSLGACIYLLKACVAEMPDELAQHYVSDAPVTAKLLGTVIESRPATDGSRLTFILDVEGIETEKTRSAVSGCTQVNWYQPAARVEAGDIVEVTGKLKLLRGFKNPGVFDYERYMYRRGIFTRMFVRGADSVAVKGNGTLNWPHRFREYFRREGLHIISCSTRTEETRAFMSAILLGERSLLTDEMEDWFRETGTFHILAISGLHIGLIYLIVSLALTPLPLGARTRVAVSLFMVWLFAFVTGGSVSVTRASIMLTIVLAGYYLNREGDFLTSVAVAALLIVALDPVVIDEAGFQLSFTAVGLLCTFEPFFSEKFYPLIQGKLQMIPAPVLHKLAITLFASLIIGVGMLPLVAYHFNMASFVFPLANLIVIPVLSLVLASGFACLLAGFIWLKAALVFGLLTEAFAWTIFATVKLCSMAPASSMRVASPPLWVLGLEALAIALVWWRVRPTRKLALFAGATLLTLTTAFAANHRGEKPLRATFLDVGDADSCFLEFPGGETMLVDTGFATPFLDCGERLIAPFLWKKRVTEIDTLVLTHPDADHTGGALFLIENFRIGRLLLADLAETPPEFSQLLQAMEERGYPVETAGAGDVLAGFKGVTVEVLNPPPGASRDNISDNETSLALRITHGETSLFLGGDAEKKALRFMSGRGNKLRSHVLKAPHHGFRSGFNRTFVELVQPELTVISGRVHRAGQHIEGRIARYAPLCNTVLATGTSGAIVVDLDRHKIKTRLTRKARANLF